MLGIPFPQIELAGAARVLVALLLVAAAQCLGALGTLRYPGASICTHFVSLALAQWPALYMARLGAEVFPSPRGRWQRWLLGHTVCFALFVVLVVLLWSALRRLAEAVFGLALPSSDLAGDLLRSVPGASVVYLLGVSASLAARSQLRLQRATRAALALRRELGEARLARLRARLDPVSVLGSLERARTELANDWRAAERELLQLSDGLRERAGAPARLDGVAEERFAMTSPSAEALLALEARTPLLPFSPRSALASLAAFLALAGLQGSALVASGDSLLTYVVLATGAVSGWVVMPVPFVAMRVTQRLRPARRWLAIAAVHVAGYGVFSAVGVVVARLLQAAAGALLGRPLREPTSPWYDWLLGLQGAVVAYALLAALFFLFETRRLARLRAARERELAAQLAEARLAALDARVEPHFLFNALNTVEAILQDDAERSAQLLESLQTLLEAALDARAPTWALREELHHTEHFLRLVRTRLGDRIQVTCQVDGFHEATQVPRFAVQTLVENTIKHNAKRTQPLHVEVRAYLRQRGCALVVCDDGAGFTQNAAQRSGGGLTRLAESLRLLYGERAALRWRDRPGGGAEVTLDLPRDGRL